MNNPILIKLTAVLLLATTALAEGEPKKEIVIRRRIETDGPHLAGKPEKNGPVEMEKIAYLGIETMPVEPALAAQLGLPRGTGVVIRRVADGSPAAGLLQLHDVLTKIDDQILVNMPQLTVLVRNHKVGDEVKLTLLRAGKETKVKAALGEREVPKDSLENPGGEPGMFFFGQNAPGGGNGFFQHNLPFPPEGPGADPGEAMRAIGEDRMHWFAKPRVHVIRRQGGKGSSILDLPAGNFVFSDDKGSIEVNAANDKRELTVKDPSGAVVFQGPINTPEEHEKLPAEVKARLGEIGNSEFDDGPGELKIETKIFDPAQKTSIERVTPRDAGAEFRSF